MNKKPIMYVDMDDTINEYSEYHKHRRQKNPDNKYPQMEYGFFLNLRPINFITTYLDILSKHYDIWILTRPSVPNPLCYTEKRVWVEKYLGREWCDKLIICPDKSLLKGDYLVDDYDWKDFEGELIRFGSDEFPSWKEVKHYLLGKL